MRCTGFAFEDLGLDEIFSTCCVDVGFTFEDLGLEILLLCCDSVGFTFKDLDLELFSRFCDSVEELDEVVFLFLLSSSCFIKLSSVMTCDIDVRLLVVFLVAFGESGRTRIGSSLRLVGVFIDISDDVPLDASP